jgi:hypothetical protein
MRSFWLCKKSSRLRALRARAIKPKGKTPEIELEVFAPKSEKEVAGGTITRAKATCLACERVLAPDRVRAQLREQRGGADTIFDAKSNRVGGARLLAAVSLLSPWPLRAGPLLLSPWPPRVLSIRREAMAALFPSP